jgi:2-keto-3-deoxy-L-rhamnonate aldolase RhmA
VLTPELLAGELRMRGVVILGVGRHRDAADVLVVYLHGNAGQWATGSAVRRTSRVRGVLRVVESVQTPTILLVRVETTAPVEPMSGGDDITEV